MLDLRAFLTFEKSPRYPVIRPFRKLIFAESHLHLFSSTFIPTCIRLITPDVTDSKHTIHNVRLSKSKSKSKVAVYCSSFIFWSSTYTGGLIVEFYLQYDSWRGFGFPHGNMEPNLVVTWICYWEASVVGDIEVRSRASAGCEDCGFLTRQHNPGEWKDRKDPSIEKPTALWSHMMLSSGRFVGYCSRETLLRAFLLKNHLWAWGKTLFRRYSTMCFLFSILTLLSLFI